MPHFRDRYALTSLERKLRFARVVSVQGVRQCGKSFLVKHFLSESHPQMRLERFDLGETRTFAAQNPDLFLRERIHAAPLVIDEAQKVPAIFDAIKVRVDEDPSPGRYVLLGSTEFSHQFKIQESLTGRMSRLRLFPLSLGEIQRLSNKNGDFHRLLHTEPRVSVDDVLLMFERGGMPGIFATRSEQERMGLFEDWVNLTCNRDLHQFPRSRLDSDLALEILRAVAMSQDPILSVISKLVRTSSKIVYKHLKALESLFVLHRLKPHNEGTGKDRYFLCDVGIASFLGAQRQRLLETWLVHEFCVKQALRAAPSRYRLSYYRTSKGSSIALILEDETEGLTFALHALYQDKADRRDAAILKSFAQSIQKNKSKSSTKFIPCISLANPTARKLDNVFIFPWASIV